MTERPTIQPCAHAECGGEIHTDGWGNPVRCPNEPSWLTAAAFSPAIDFTPPPPTITITGANGQPLVTIHPDGHLDYGPGYTPDTAARAFWDALRRLAPAGCPECGHVGLETP